MFWALLASGIMLLTGAGDDAFLEKKMLDAMEKSVKQVVVDVERREMALQNVRGFRQLLMDHRRVLGEVSDCLEKLDRTYEVTEQEYHACLSGVDVRWAETEEEFLRLNREQKTVLTGAEMEAVAKKVLKELK